MIKKEREEETKQQSLNRKLAEQEVTLARLKGVKDRLVPEHPRGSIADTLILIQIAIDQLEEMIAQDR